jgi:hypothetical protein
VYCDNTPYLAKNKCLAIEGEKKKDFSAGMPLRIYKMVLLHTVRYLKRHGNGRYTYGLTHKVMLNGRGEIRERPVVRCQLNDFVVLV